MPIFTLFNAVKDILPISNPIFAKKIKNLESEHKRIRI